MKLSKEELYRLHYFFSSLGRNFFFFALALRSFSSEEKEFFSFFFGRARERKEKSFCLAFCPLALPSTLNPCLPPLVLLPTPCESCFRSIEEDEIIGLCEKKNARWRRTVLLLLLLFVAQMRLTRAAPDLTFLLLVSFCCEDSWKQLL